MLDVRHLDRSATLSLPSPHLPRSRILQAVVDKLAVRGPLRIFRPPLVDLVPMRRARCAEADRLAVFLHAHDKQPTTVAIRLVHSFPKNKSHVLPVWRDLHTMEISESQQIHAGNWTR